ncbi:S8 family serine peptidase [Actinomadura sp. 9N407]|uniref:S8 family serine peptidase n=1 Tax=Actinomadura sp. 9N407 TaxID=3375154 RepID=UPI0037AD5C45
MTERQWWFDTWGIENLVWPKTKGAGVTVAVLDTGVEASLPDMRGAVVPGKAFRVSGDGSSDTEDDGDFGHGTGMASLIASRGTKTGFTGVAPEAKIMPLATPGVADSSSPDAIRFAVDNGAKIISVSLGSPSETHQHQCPADLLSAVAYAAKKDVIIVASAGNEGASGNKPIYPASCPGVVAVGAMDNRGQAWENTQRQDYVTLGAPGVNIPALSQDGRVWPNGEGSSHAAALVAGGFALLRSEFPQKSAREIVQLATNTAKDFGPPGKDNTLGYGVLSLRTALSKQVPASAPNPVYERLDKVMGQVNAQKPPNAKAAEAAEESSGMSPLILVGGAVVLIGAALLVVFLFLRRGKRSGPQIPPSPPSHPGYGQGGPGSFNAGPPQPPGPGTGQPQPQYGPPQHGPPQHGPPQHGQPQYGQPPQGQPPQGQAPVSGPPGPPPGGTPPQG